MGISVILTGATGMVGEGVLLSCLEHPAIEKILIVSRRASPLKHAKLKELLVPDFFNIEGHSALLSGYDACFYCAGISSVGMKEEQYSFITYDTTMHFARKLVELNPGMVFNFVSGSHTDSSGQGKIMWARVKGRTENALLTLGFKGQYNFRPGAMRQVAGQRNVKFLYRLIVGIIGAVSARRVCSLQDIAKAMIYTTVQGYDKSILEVADIKKVAKG